MILPEIHLPNADTPISHVASNGTMVDGGAMPVLSLGPVRDSQGQGAQETHPGSSSKEEERRKQLKRRPASSMKRSSRVVIDLEDPSLSSAGDHPLNPIVLN
jgi:hypothetical protein